MLDIGGSLFNWAFVSHQSRLAMLNIHSPKEGRQRWVQTKNASWIVADGCHLPSQDETFDLAYSNSVIEHLGNIAKQKAFADECRRVGIRHYMCRHRTNDSLLNLT